MIKDKAALKHETHLDDCADMYVSIAENTSITGQRIAVGEWHTSSIYARGRANRTRCRPEYSVVVTKVEAFVRCSVAGQVEVAKMCWWWPELLYNGWVEDIRSTLLDRLFDLGGYTAGF